MKKNNFKTRLLCLLLSIFTLIPLTTQVYAVDSISNTDGHWAGETMLYWNSLGLFKDVPEDEFGIDKAISRGAFVHIFNRMIHVPAPESLENNFNDISEADWNYNDIVIANNIGYINGYPNKTFRAASPISREEMCAIVSRYYDLAKVYDNTKLQNFTDKDTIQDYATDAVGALAELEIVKGYPSGAFKPQNNITWAEAVTIITRFLGYINGGSGVSGRVYYEDKPVYNAEITVFNNDEITIAAKALSDLYGDYIMDVPEGTYDITIKKDGKISMLADVAVSGDVRTYNKAELLPGQYVTGRLVDTKNNAVADKTLTFTGDSSIAVTTDAAGKIELTLPENGFYSIYAEVDGKIVELADFKTGSIESGLDLGDIILSSGKTTVKNAPAELPWWYLDSFFRDETGKDNNEPDKKPDEDETPDYSKLPYREPKTMAELVELNGGVQPKIMLNKDNTVGLYVGKLSENKIYSVEDVISELNIVSDLFGFDDSRIEYIPYGKDGKIGQKSYKLQQVYNGTIILSTGLTVSVDNEQHISAISGKYIGEIKYENINNDDIISKKTCEQVIIDYFKDILHEDDIQINSNKLIIHNTEYILIYYSQVTAHHNVWKVMVNAKSGEIYSCSKLENSFNNISSYYGYDSGIFGYNRKSIIDYAPRKAPYSCGNIHNIFDVRINDYYDLFTSKKYSAEIKETKLSNDLKTVYDAYANLANHYSIDGEGRIPVNAYLTHEYRIKNANGTDDFKVFNNAVALADYYNGSQIIIFGTDNSSLTTVGHEYTHAVQKNIIKYENDVNVYGGFSTDYSESEKISANIAWVESQAISEGTADVMGILISCIDKGFIQNSDVKYRGESYEIKASDETHHRTYDYLISHYVKDKKTSLTSCTVNKPECYVTNDSLTYMAGVGHNDRYICGGILYSMVEQNMTDPKLLFQLWYHSIEKLYSKATFNDLMYALINTAVEMGIEDYVDKIICSCNKVGIGVNVCNESERWLIPSLFKISSTGILSTWINENEQVDYWAALSRKDFIQLVIDFCNTWNAGLTVTYAGNKAILKLPSSNQSMSLIFDESKDILRWEAFIITDRILNYCWEAMKNSDLTVEYNFPYLDNTTKDKAKNYAEFIRLLANSETEVKNGLPKVDTAEVLNMYYGGLTYDQFYESYMYVRNSENAKDNTKYDFSGDGYQFTESQRVVLDSMYNIYMSLEKNLAPVVKDSNNDVGFNVCKPMTLASACYLLYAYMQK